MATYTIELRRVCDLYGREEVEKWFTDYEISHYLNPKQIETMAKYKIWSKERLAQKIVDHYYLREIGQETPALFKHFAKVKMQEIMERYLPIIYTNAIEYDPLESVDYTTTEERTIDGDASGNSKSNSKNNGSGLNISNNTPQTRITKQDLNTGAYASNVSQSDTESKIEDETNTSSKTKTIEKFTRHEMGNKGVLDSYQKMIIQFRETIAPVDEEIIKELNSLFMGLY